VSPESSGIPEYHTKPLPFTLAQFFFMFTKREKTKQTITMLMTCIDPKANKDDSVNGLHVPLDKADFRVMTAEPGLYRISEKPLEQQGYPSLILLEFKYIPTQGLLFP
jgi:hypothetical protein